MMQIHELVQGSQEWLDHRANIFNASDAPAMMGCSPYKTRDELLREMATGIAKDTSGSEFLFAKGHEAEAKARPLAEMRVGDDLYPITGTNDAYGLPRPLGASFDGLTMGFDTSFEHKLMNEAIRNAKTVEDLGLVYRIQMEQQLMVCEGDRNIFMATNWNGEKLTESREFWYESDPDLRLAILLGWQQFAKDLEAYVHSEEVAKVEAAPVLALPTLYIKAEGSIAVRDNLKQFGIEMNAYIAKIPKEPSTDQEFADAKKSVGILKTAEDELRAAKDSVLAQITTVGDMSRMADLLIETASTTRLMVDKLVKAREKSVKLEKLNASKAELAKHIAGLETEIKPITLVGMVAHPDWDTATKNKRTLTSLQSALNDEVAKQKINADALAKKVRENLSWCKEHAAGKGSLFPDLQQIVFNEHDHFILIINERIAKAEQEEAERIEAIRVEEKEKAEASVRAEIAEKERIAAEALKQPETAPEAVSAPKTTPGAVSAKEAPKYISGRASQSKYVHPMHGNNPSEKNPPEREKLIEVIAEHFSVDDSFAEMWLVKRFGQG